jgi:signal transduction histidine kinase
MVQIAHDNCQRLVRLINDLLDFQKIEAGKMTFREQPVELVALVDAAVTENRPYADPKRVRFEVVAEVADAWVLADSDRLLQVMSNLMSNAVKFSPAGDTVAVSVARRDDRIRVAVTDRGPGVPEAFRPKLFEKFAQADASDTRQRGGTGLGLRICKRIVEHLGGEIGFTIEPNRATTFYFDLPELPGQSRVAPALAHGADGRAAQGLY